MGKIANALAVTAAGLILAAQPVAASTRPGNSLPSQSVLTVENARAASPLRRGEAEEAGLAIPIEVLIAIFLALGIGIVLIVESGDSSPGT